MMVKHIILGSVAHVPIKKSSWGPTSAANETDGQQAHKCSKTGPFSWPIVPDQWAASGLKVDTMGPKGGPRPLNVHEQNITDVFVCCVSTLSMFELVYIKWPVWPATGVTLKLGEVEGQMGRG